MKALLPVYCRPLGYVVLLVALFIPFILVMQGVVTDTNLLFYKECTKLLMMAGCLLIIFALSKNESRETEQIRNSAVRNAIFLTFLFVFGGMLWRVMQGWYVVACYARRCDKRRYFLFPYFSGF